MKKTPLLKLRSALALLLLFGAAIPAQAFNISVLQGIYEADHTRYNFEVSGWLWTDGGESPCARRENYLTTCVVRLEAIRGSYTSVGSYATWRITTQPGMTMGGLFQWLWQAGLRIPLTGYILVPRHLDGDDICITFTASQIGANVGGAIGPFGPCTKVPKPMLQCEITGDNNINHRALPDNALDGAQASTQLNLKCRGPGSMTVSASRTNNNGVQLRDDNSLYSKITVNGRDATAGINVQVNDGLARPLIITSTLVTRGTVAPGAFSGSTVITVSPP